jgi:hypothetical protein
VNLNEFQAKISNSNLFSTFPSPAVPLLLTSPVVAEMGITPEVCDLSASAN